MTSNLVAQPIIIKDSPIDTPIFSPYVSKIKLTGTLAIGYAKKNRRLGIVAINLDLP